MHIKRYQKHPFEINNVKDGERQRFEGFEMFLKEVLYAHQNCIYLIKNTIILWNIITI